MMPDNSNRQMPNVRVHDCPDCQCNPDDPSTPYEGSVVPADHRAQPDENDSEASFHTRWKRAQGSQT